MSIAFLKFNVPTVTSHEDKNKSHKVKLATLKNVTGRFLNASGDLELDADDNFNFIVNTCHFANYARQLGVAELAPLFCAADKVYFYIHQPDVNLIRTVTLASRGRPYDFHLEWSGTCN